MMADTERTSEESTESRSSRVLRTKGLFADYNVGQRPGGEWFALGSVRSDLQLPLRPAWVLVGTGSTAEAAVGHLQIELETEARRLQSA